jgi:hypothetical protein
MTRTVRLSALPRGGPDRARDVRAGGGVPSERRPSRERPGLTLRTNWRSTSAWMNCEGAIAIRVDADIGLSPRGPIRAVAGVEGRRAFHSLRNSLAVHPRVCGVRRDCASCLLTPVRQRTDAAAGDASRIHCAIRRATSSHASSSITSCPMPGKIVSDAL